MEIQTQAGQKWRISLAGEWPLHKPRGLLLIISFSMPQTGIDESKCILIVIALSLCMSLLCCLAVPLHCLRLVVRCRSPGILIRIKTKLHNVTILVVHQSRVGRDELFQLHAWPNFIRIDILDHHALYLRRLPLEG